MKMFVQHPSWFGSQQYEVIVRELYFHDGYFIALHRPHGRYDFWTVSELVSGLAITSSTSKKFALEKAKKLITKHKMQMPSKQIDALERLNSSINNSVNYKLMERIERKCVARGKTSVKVIEIKREHADTLWLQEHVEQ